MSKAGNKTTRSRPAGKPGRGTTGLDRRRAARKSVPARSASGVSRGTIVGGALIATMAVVVLFLIYQASQSEPEPAGPAGNASGYQHAAGEPGTGERAPDFTLASTGGGKVSVADFRGKSVLLYFQEGLMCQPCWQQITDLEANQAALDKAGIDEIVSITSDPLQQLKVKVADEKLATPTLSDPTLEVIRAYDANQYGMMGDSRAGHSFILVGPDGTIQWRADYGGAPDYTMFLPTEKMLADLAKERAK